MREAVRYLDGCGSDERPLSGAGAMTSAENTRDPYQNRGFRKQRADTDAIMELSEAAGEMPP